MIQGPDLALVQEKLEEVERRSKQTKDEIKKLNTTITSLLDIIDEFQASGLHESTVTFKHFVTERVDISSSALVIYLNHSWPQIRKRLEDYEQHIRVLNHVLQSYRKERIYLKAEEEILLRPGSTLASATSTT